MLPGSLIDVSGKGSPAGSGPTGASDSSRGATAAYKSSRYLAGGGGSNAGQAEAEKNQNNGHMAGGAPNPGDGEDPLIIGAGGGISYSNSYSSASGGGLIRIEITGKFVFEGTLKANGGDILGDYAANYNGGAGAGGSINIKVLDPTSLGYRFIPTLGTIEAKGGGSTDSYSGAGGGGYVRIQTPDADPSIPWSGLLTTDVSGGVTLSDPAPVPSTRNGKVKFGPPSP